jgi:cobalt-zinc-cadmium efflux system membrane fusion protein
MSQVQGEKRAMKIEKKYVFGLALAAILVAAGIRLFNPVQPKPPVASSFAPGTFRPTRDQWANLAVAPVQAMTFRTELSAEGNLAYNEDAMTQVFSPYTGRVTRIIAKPGDRVKKGAPLMAVAASEFVQGQSDLIAARTQLTLAEAAEKRQHALYLAKSGALKDWLQSQADLAAAQNSLQAARERLRILGKSDRQIRAMERASGAVSPEALVLAPISGTVTQRQVGLGQYINSAAGGAANPVYTLSDLSTLWLIANVREADAGSVRVGQPVEVHVSAYPGRLYKAGITWVAPAIDPGTRRLPVRAEIKNPDGTLKAMMFASFSIIAGDESVAPGVPRSAIVFDGEATRVYVVRSDGTVVLRQVKLGRVRDDGMVEVVSGLAAGEKIITGGTLFIDRAVTVGMNSGS